MSFPTGKNCVIGSAGIEPFDQERLVMMSKDNGVRACRNPRCLGNYDFEDIARFAKKRFVEGFETVALLEQAKSEREREEIALVCLLDLEDDVIKDLRLDCRHADQCKATDCRDRLKKLIEQDLAAEKTNKKGPID
jgi:hypothetical protein